MRLFLKIRRARPTVLAALLMTVCCLAGSAQQPQPNSHESTAPHMVPHSGYPTLHHPGRDQEHLLQWMDRHSNLTPDQQQRALEREPGFHDLPPQTQQRMRDRLSQLNHMNPDRRRRWLERNEAIAQLAPQQRQQVRDAMHQFGSLPPERRHQVAQAFRELRDLPPDQQQNLVNSDQYRARFSPDERQALSGLLSIEPYHVIRPTPHGEPEGPPNR